MKAEAVEALIPNSFVKADLMVAPQKGCPEPQKGCPGTQKGYPGIRKGCLGTQKGRPGLWVGAPVEEEWVAFADLQSRGLFLAILDEIGPRLVKPRILVDLRLEFENSVLSLPSSIEFGPIEIGPAEIGLIEIVPIGID